MQLRLPCAKRTADIVVCASLVFLISSLSSKPLYCQSSSDQTSQAPRWESNLFASGGFVPNYEIRSPALRFHEELDFYSAGFELGRMVSSTYGPGLLQGRGEALVEVIPFWLARYPLQENLTYYNNGITPPSPTGNGGPYDRHGITVTPVLFRWNFTPTKERRVIPWVQLGGGLLWTNHKFPLLGGSTSVINFTPQAGLGANVFTKPHQSVSLAVKAVHISNAGLGDNNPGLNVTLQFAVGYSWWR